MSDATDRARFSPSGWSDAPDSSALVGLRRRALDAVDVLAPSLAATKPAASALVVPVLVSGFVGRGAWLSIVVGIVGALLLRLVITEFTSRMVSSGSLYSFVVRSLGPWAGLVTAVAMLVGYGFASGYALTGTGLAARALATQEVGPVASLRIADVAVVLAIGLLCGVVLMRRVSTLTAVTMVIQVVTVACVGVLVLVVLLRGHDLAAAWSLQGADPARIVGGASIVLAMLVGFECSASLGPEAAQPYKTVPWAMLVSLLVTGALCLTTTLALAADPATSLLALHQSVRVEHVWFPGGSGTALSLFRVTRILSLVACTLAVWAAMTRLVFTLAHEGVLPAGLARTHPTRLTPQRAVLWTAPLVIGPGAVLVAGNHGLQTITASLLDTAGLVMLIAYLLVCLAVPVFLRQLGEITGRAVATATAAGVMVGLAILSNLNWQQERGDADFVVLVAAGILPAATWWYVTLRRRVPCTFSRMGLHDQTIATDVWHGAPDVLGPRGAGRPS